MFDPLFQPWQREPIAPIGMQAVGWDSTAGQVPRDGMGAFNKTEGKPSAHRAAEGRSRFIGLPPIPVRL